MKLIKNIGKAFIVAFSIYSKIPMPSFVWKSEDMRYHLCFFPFVGAVIGALEWLWYLLCTQREVSGITFLFFAVAIPVLVTGGFHLDGFMDTMDAIHSYQEKEKKLEILKDPHIGAFAVISLVACLLTAVAFLAQIKDRSSLMICCMGFFLSRTLSGISVITMKGAKKNGMLQTFSETAVKSRVLTILALELVLCGAGILWIDILRGAAVLAISGISFLHYRYMSYKQFGGITGDLAGYFVTVTELLILLVLGILGCFAVV